MSVLRNIKTRAVRRRKNGRGNRPVRLRAADEFQSVLLVLPNENELLVSQAQSIFCNAALKCLYARSKKEDTSEQFRYSVHPSDFNLTGLLKNDKLQKLFHTKFQLVVDLSAGSELLNYFVRGIESELVIGQLGSTNESLHDLLLENRAGQETFLITIKKQLNQLRHGHHTI